MDTGAQCCLMNRSVYDSLKYKPKLHHRNAALQTVNGEPLHLDGCVELPFEISGIKMSQTFFIVRNMNRKIILGHDWLQKHGVRLYYDLGCIKVNETYVPLQQDIHISSIVRTHAKTKVKPQTAVICKCKVRNSPDLPISETYQISPTDTGFLGHEPGLMVTNSVAKMSGNRFIPVLLVNSTNKTYTVKKGCPIAKVELVQGQTISLVDQCKKTSDTCQASEHFKDTDVPEEYRSDVINLLKANSDLFAQKDSELSHTDTVKMKIDTGEHPPIKLRPYRTPLNNRKVIDDAIDEMLDAKIIERSKSPWSFPVVIVDKKDGSKRFCVDFRALNKITKSNSYPLPVIDDILAQLGQAKYFTSLDLKSGYWQVLMYDSDKEKTAFACHRGLFQFNVMPFGLTTAPAIFQELMSRVLEGLDKFTVAYLDDILIFSSTLEEHLAHIQSVFDKLREHGLRLKLKKCSFLKSETNYLGFVINEQGIKPEARKVNVIKALAPPTTVREVRSLVGMCSYYRRFIPHFSEIAEPIIALTRKYAKFKWDNKCQKAFETLKDKLSEFPVLGYPDPNRKYILYTDASHDCIGACLTQPCDDVLGSDPCERNERPIYYLSHKLSDTQTRWSTIEKEAFAIHFALQKLDHYLHNAEFVIKTDHKPLKYLLDSPIQNKKIQLWALGISGYNCRIEYIKGTDNSCADLLSRIPESAGLTQETDTYEPDINDKAYQINALNSNRFDPREFASCKLPPSDSAIKPTLGAEVDMATEQSKDALVMELIIGLQQDKLSKSVQKRHIVMDNVLYYISNADSDPVLRLYIPEHLQDSVIKQYHDWNGHMGLDKTYDTMKQKYYWPNMYKDIYTYVGRCVTCQARSLQKVKAPLQETDIPPYAFAKIGLDVSGPYPTSLSGNKYIVGFVDWYSGYPEAFAVPDKSADTIAHLIIEEIFPRYGAPLEIVSDNGSENVNKKVKETLEALNIHHVKTSLYHPASNSKVERFHRVLHDVLAKKLKDNVTSWDQFLNQALAAIRFNVSESSKFSPFFLLYNRDVVLPLDHLLKPRRKYVGEDAHQIALEQQHKSFVLVHKHLKRARKRQKKYADRKAKDIKFEVGDPVYYSIPKKSKLNLGWRPYYRIIEKTSPVTFKIKHQLNGSVLSCHADNIRKANVDKWEIPEPSESRLPRNTTYVVPPGTDSSNSDSSDDDVPLAKLAQRYRHQRDDSDNEDPIPRMELAKHGRRKEKWYEEESEQYSDSASSVNSMLTDNQDITDQSEIMNCEENQCNSQSEHSDIDLSVEQASVVPYHSTKAIQENKPLDTTCNLLTAIVSLLEASKAKQ
ncbi:MAG: DDE-type integrase/transposase/recombinase [Candidatus Thiodiazotropha taylori]|nr:DDE-type integrase/transposase/recombinase [Candidatus Thiodiazotropha taylori]